MSLHDAWTSLRHGGNLLSPAALDGLPDPEIAPWKLADRLRTALVSLDPDRPTAGALGTLLDVVLEEACGLGDGWQKGNALGAADAEKLLDGTALKPRRRWTGPGSEMLAVFTTREPRIGVGRGRRPAARVVEYLRRRALPLAVLTNGRQWRLIWADTDSLAWAEWEADHWLAADQLSEELAVLRRVLSPASLGQAAADQSPLLAAIRETRRGQARLSKELGERVRRAVELLLESRQPVIAPTWDDHAAAELYVAACHFVMRLVVTLFAEVRELLPADNPIYHQAYGLRGLLDQLDRQTPERRKTRRMAWPRLLALFRLLHGGSPHPAMTLPAYGGDLFRPGADDGDGVQQALARLEALPEPPNDDVIHRTLVLLTRTTQKVREGAGWRTVAAPVDFTELTSEYIGILYEGLLDYELHRAGDEPIVFLNLGDQPALPLDRLEAMDDKALKALVEKAKVKKQVTSEEEGDDQEDEAEDADAAGDDADAEEGDSDDDAETDDALAVDEMEIDDARGAALARAEAWSRRAAEVGKLVKKPKGRKADAVAAYEAQLTSAAKQLVASVRLPGELYLVRWGGTRKGAGTFYTRPQLTLPTVRRTLQPLLYQGEEVTADALRPPEALLALKVCDPAMGSGSFLVAALRVLTAAVVESLHVHDRIAQRNGKTTVDCELLPEADRSLPTEGFEERLEAIVRRAVVEHCLYGVDLDPLAVELARVALWIETLDRRLPFTFLDHKLRCGDALVGTWLDRFRDYPLLCFDRVSPDRKYKGVHHEADVWHQALKEKRAEAIAQQVEILSGQLRLQAPASDEDLRAAVERVRRLYRDLRAVPAGRPDERARIWRERIQTDAALAKVREAFDTWCALWFWPLDQLDAMPLPSELHAPGEAAREVVQRLREKRRFFHWELEFPDVFTEEGAGFDAVVGNPPWETVHSQKLEFFSNLDPLYRSLPSAQARATRERLYQEDRQIEENWLSSVAQVKALTNWARESGRSGTRPFHLQDKGKPYTHRMFLELAIHLTKHDGRIGMILPTSVTTEKGSIKIRKRLLNKNRIEWIYDFQNSEEIFPIHRSSRFAALIVQRGGTTLSFSAAVMVADMACWGEEPPSCMDISATFVRSFSPDDYSLPLFESEADTNIVQAMLENGLPFRGDGDGSWGVQYSRELNMSDDKRLFTRRDALEASSSVTAIGNFVSEDGIHMLPLVEGRNTSQFQILSKRWVSGKGRTSKWATVEPGTTPTGAQYYLGQSQCLATKIALAPKIAVMDVTGVTNTRSVIASCCADLPSGHSVNMAFFPTAIGRTKRALALCAVLNSFPFDWLVRQRMTGQHVSRYFIKDVPIPTPDPTLVVATFVLRLNATHPSFARWWSALSNHVPAYRKSWALTRHERLRLRCILDAIVAALYGLDRDDFAWILKDCDHPTANLSDKAFCRRLDPKGFWRVDKKEDPELRHTVLSLAAFDDLQVTIAAAGGDRDAGIEAFCEQHDGDGWMLPEALCLAELGLTRTVDIGDYDERARGPQPVRGRMGERFLDWQLAQTPEESWAECERHAKAILEGMQAPAESETEEAAVQEAEPIPAQPRLPGMEP